MTDDFGLMTLVCPDCGAEVNVSHKRLYTKYYALVAFGICFNCKGQGRTATIMGVLKVSRDFYKALMEAGIKELEEAD